LLDREFNLSYAATQPAHNEVVQGRWLADEADAISVEVGLAKDLGLQLGDRLSFDMAGMVVSGKITSLRKVDWGGMRANFFVIFPVAQLGDVPVTYMSAFKAPDAKGFDRALLRQFPNVTNVDMSFALGQVQRVLEQVIGAMQLLFALTLLAGLLVLFAAVTATRQARTREFAVLRALGATDALLRQVQRAELAGVGLLAGLLAGAVALALHWALARFVFELTWGLSSLWIVGACGLFGAALALAAGWWGLRSVLHAPVMQTLRGAAQ